MKPLALAATKSLKRTITMGIYILVPIVLLLLPADFFDHGESISLFSQLGVEGFYSQGLTRASMHLIHLDFAAAAEFNPLAFLVVPLIAVVWGMGFVKTWRNQPSVRPPANSKPSFRSDAPYFIALAFPLIGMALFFHYFLLNQPEFTMVWAMPILVAFGSGAGLTVFGTARQTPNTRWWACIAYTVFAITVAIVLYRIFAH